MLFKILTWLGVIISIIGFTMYLLDKSNWWRFKHLSHKTLIIIALSSLVTAITIASIEKYIEYINNPKHFTKSQIQAASVIMGEISLKMLVINNELMNLEKTYTKWQEVNEVIKESSYNYSKEAIDDFFSTVDFRLKTVSAQQQNLTVPENELKILAKTRIPIIDAKVFYTTAYSNTLIQIINFYKELQSLSITLFPQNYEERKFMYDVYSRNFQLPQLSGKMLFYSYIYLIADMPETVKKEFYENYKPMLTNFPLVETLNKEQAKSLSDSCFEKYKNLLSELEIIMASEDKHLDNIKNILDRISLKIEINENLKETLTVKKSELKYAQESFREKFKLKKDDDQWLMWGKIARFGSAMMYKDAIKNIDKYIELNIEKDKNITKYTPVAKSYYKNYLDYKLKNYTHLEPKGVLVVGFENNKNHKNIQIGDIITNIDGDVVKNADSFVELRKNSTNKTITLLRLKQNGVFEEITVKKVENQPKIGVISLFD